MELDRRTCIGTICSFLAYLLNPFRRRKGAEEIPLRALVQQTPPKAAFDAAFYQSLGDCTGKQLSGSQTPSGAARKAIRCFVSR